MFRLFASLWSQERRYSADIPALDHDWFVSLRFGSVHKKMNENPSIVDTYIGHDSLICLLLGLHKNSLALFGCKLAQIHCVVCLVWTNIDIVMILRSMIAQQVLFCFVLEASVGGCCCCCRMCCCCFCDSLVSPIYYYFLFRFIIASVFNF